MQKELADKKKRDALEHTFGIRNNSLGNHKESQMRYRLHKDSVDNMKRQHEKNSKAIIERVHETKSIDSLSNQ